MTHRFCAVRLIACASLLLAGRDAVARDNGPDRSLPVRTLTRDLATLDFDDPAWDEASAARGLIQQEPREGQPATLATEFRVLATPSALLIRFVMEQPPGEIVAREMRRDADLSSDDRISFVFDTYHDHRNAYYFSTNPNGVRVDGLVTEEGQPSLDWDTVWDVRVRRTAAGWDALFAIPFTSLNFPGGAGGIWGFNVSRDMRRRTETARWTAWKRPYELYKISQAGNLTAVPAMPRRRLRSLTPYAAGAVDHRQDPSDTDLLGKAGLDFRYGIGTATEADLTVNTDFAETEPDAQQFNFGRASLFFPEKRSFFLQRAQTFAFGDENLTLPFFSRTIGLKTEDDLSQVVPINAGLKLAGQVGGSDFGALAVQTRAAAGEPRTEFYVGRLKQDIGHASYLGGLYTDIERGSSDPQRKFSRTYGADAGINLTPEWNLAGYYVKTDNPGVSGHTDAWRGAVSYNGEYFRGTASRADTGSAYDPQMGFVTEYGIHSNFVDFEITPRPHVLGLRDLSFETFYWTTYNEDSSLHGREYQYTFRANWQNGAYTDEDIVDTFDENLTEALELTDTVTIPVGRYHFVRHQVSFGTNPSRPFAFQANANWGGYYGGSRDRYTGRIFWKPSPHLSVAVIEEYDVVRLPQGNFNLSLFSGRVDWNPSVKIISSLIVQSDSVDRLTNIQAIARWLIDPATDLFFVFDRQIGKGFERPGTRLTLKFRKTFDL